MAHRGTLLSMMQGQQARLRTHDGSAWTWSTTTPNLLKVSPVGKNPACECIITSVGMSASDPHPILVLTKPGAEAQCFSFNIGHANRPAEHLPLIQADVDVPRVAEAPVEAIPAPAQLILPDDELPWA